MSDTERAIEHQFHIDARQAFLQQNLKWETENAFLNHQQLCEMHMAGRARCLSECPPSRGPAIVIGSGSTLDGVIDRLKDWKGAIICGSSHGPTLVHHGCPPTFVACLDPRVAPDPELDVPDGGWDQTLYLAHVSSPKPYFDKWFSQTSRIAYVFRILEPTLPWYTKHLLWAYPWIKKGMLPFIDSISSNISLAAKMGYDPLFCIGVDYGGPRFQQSNWTGKEWQVAAPSGTTPLAYKDLVTGERCEPIVGVGGLTTDAGMTYAKRGLLISSFMCLMDYRNPTRIYQMSKPSNVIEFPFVSFEEVLEKQGQGFPWTPEYQKQVAETIEISLARTDTFMVPVEGGFGTDYRVYLLTQDNIVPALSGLSGEMLSNKRDLQTKERDSKISIRRMIEKGLLSVEMGELVIHDREDLKYFDVNSMKGVDVEVIGDRIRMLYDKGKAG